MFFIHVGDATGRTRGSGMVLSCCRPHEKDAEKIRRWQFGQKKSLPRATSPQKRMLKMKLKIRRRTRAAGKDGLEMFHGLQQGISLRALGRSLLAAELRPHGIQTAPPFPAQPIHRFQRQGQPQFFGGGLERKPGQQFHQPRPHQRRRHRVPGQNLGQEQGKRAPATLTLPTVGAKYPLAPTSLAVGRVGIIAQRTAVTVQRPHAAAMRTRRLLEGKSWVFNS